ncbi:MAG: hypothetical protein U0797_04570 [Gemmataceae bacterium]
MRKLFFSARTKLAHLVTNVVKKEEGASAAEYALMLGVIALAVVTAVGLLRTQIVAVVDGATAALSS